VDAARSGPGDAERFMKQAPIPMAAIRRLSVDVAERFGSECATHLFGSCFSAMFVLAGANSVRFSTVIEPVVNRWFSILAASVDR
jgi:hypothetical protein